MNHFENRSRTPHSNAVQMRSNADLLSYCFYLMICRLPAASGQLSYLTYAIDLIDWRLNAESK
jgi:hypothetical protein